VEQVIPAHPLGGEVEASDAGKKAGVGHVNADFVVGWEKTPRRTSRRRGSKPNNIHEKKLL
jgi:hypothetical protein